MPSRAYTFPNICSGYGLELRREFGALTHRAAPALPSQLESDVSDGATTTRRYESRADALVLLSRVFHHPLSLIGLSDPVVDP